MNRHFNSFLDIAQSFIFFLSLFTQAFWALLSPQNTRLVYFRHGYRPFYRIQRVWFFAAARKPVMFHISVSDKGFFLKRTTSSY
jgi:hypothetical protein